MATHAHSTRTPFLPAAGHPIVASGGPVTRATLTMRAAGLRDLLEARTSRKPSDPHIPLRDRLIAAHAAAMAVRPVFEDEHPDSPAYKAALAVDNCMWALIGDILALPAPSTLEGLGAVGLALAFQVGGALAGKPWENEDKIAAAARAILAVTGTALPPAFAGFGDEAKNAPDLHLPRHLHAAAAYHLPSRVKRAPIDSSVRHATSQTPEPKQGACNRKVSGTPAVVIMVSRTPASDRS